MQILKAIKKYHNTKISTKITYINFKKPTKKAGISLLTSVKRSKPVYKHSLFYDIHRENDKYLKTSFF